MSAKRKPLLARSVTLDDFQRNSRDYPNNRLLKFMSRMMELREEGNAGIIEITSAVEPTGMPDFADLGKINHQQLDAFAAAPDQAEQMRGLPSATVNCSTFFLIFF